MKDLLIEIGVEELPAIPFLKELPNIKKKYLDVLKKFKFNCDVEFFYTPRRIIFFHKSFEEKQDDFMQEFFGAPIKIAYKDNEPTPATIGFAKKVGVSIDELSTSTKNSQEVLYYQKKIIGKNIQDCIADIITSFLKSLHFGKNMRWGKNDFNFIRPIRWICAKLNDETINFQSYGVTSSDFSYAHRQHSSQKIVISNGQEYFDILEKNGVIINQDDRRDIILEQFEKIEKQTGFTIHKDDDLLNELVVLTEHPKALLGEFDEKFLAIPKEVIIHTMRENQRYFSLLKRDILKPCFLVIADTVTNDCDKILDGNKKVLLARLEDALFFFNNDLKNGFDVESLDNVSFMKDMGSMLDKVNREKEIGLYLAKKYNEDLADTKEAISIAKADLMSEVVYEFTDLQGIVGAYYAKEFGYKENICKAIKEQYLPNSENGELPTSKLSAIVAMSNKLDLLFSLFSTNNIPTGSKDPYALRRAVIGILKIVINNKFNFNIKQVSKDLQCHYKDFDIEKLIQFYYERMYQYFTANNSLISSIMATNEYDILNFHYKLLALDEAVSNEQFREDFSTFKRVANILEDDYEYVSINKDLFENDYEKNLHKSIEQIKNNQYTDYSTHLKDLFALRKELSDFFDNVMVNDKNEEIKQNRRNILKMIYLQFRQIADIKIISI